MLDVIDDGLFHMAFSCEMRQKKENSAFVHEKSGYLKSGGPRIFELKPLQKIELLGWALYKSFEVW
jgi:hypothetical protein